MTPLFLFFPLGLLVGVFLALAFESWPLFLGVVLLIFATGLGLAAIWPVAKLPACAGAIDLRRPSNFYSGMP